MIPFNHKRILLVNIFGIGDVLFTTPLLSNIKAAYPEAFIGYLCNRRTEALLAANPHIDRTFVYEKDEWVAVARESRVRHYRYRRNFIRQLRAEHFDVALDFSLNPYISWLLLLAGIPERVGYNYKNRSPFLTRKIPFSGYEQRHVVEYYLDVCRRLGIPVVHHRLELPLTREETERAESFLAEKIGADRRFRVAMVPGGGASWGQAADWKRWPALRYAKLADKMIENFKAAIILMGSKQEENLCRVVETSCERDVLNLCGQTDLRQSAALLSRCQMAVCNDGGPLHMAVAVGTPTVSVFGPVDDRVYGPFPVHSHVVAAKDIACRPCYRRFRMTDCRHHNCLRTLTVDEVFSRIKESEAILIRDRERG